VRVRVGFQTGTGVGFVCAGASLGWLGLRQVFIFFFGGDADHQRGRLGDRGFKVRNDRAELIAVELQKPLRRRR
jgi:hypothetical protein